jgi:hypothetical protein
MAPPPALTLSVFGMLVSRAATSPPRYLAQNSVELEHDSLHFTFVVRICALALCRTLAPAFKMFRTMFDRTMISFYFERSGIYVFSISIACVYYVANAPILLGHYDLGWHLAAGDLIRDRGNIPFSDPWSFTAGGREWYNLSWLWDVIASVIFQHANFGGLILFAVTCGAFIVGYLTSVGLSSGA